MGIYPLTIFYDGDCPVCAVEINMLRRRCTDGSLLFEDIRAAHFDPAALNVSIDTLDARIHAQRADGVMLEGPEVFALAYRAVGLDMLARLITWPPLAPVTHWLYSRFARHRHRLGRWVGPLLAWRARRQRARNLTRCSEHCAPPSPQRGEEQP